MIFAQRLAGGRWRHQWGMLLLTATVLVLAFFLGRWASPSYLFVGLAACAGLVVLWRPQVGFLALILVALLLPVKVTTGTEVQLNLAALTVPALFAVWLLHGLVSRRLLLPPGAMHLPLLLFLVAGLLSLVIGIAIWDPFVPRRDGFLLVQLAQWAIFAFSAMAFWLTALLARGQRALQIMTIIFLVVGGGLVLLRIVPAFYPLFARLTTGAVDRAPFWLLMAALAGGQLFFNRRLRLPLQVVLAALLGLVGYYAFFLARDNTSTWVGVAVVVTVLLWLRFPRWRAFVVLVILVLGLVGVLAPAVWEFAGGDAEWVLSGGSRFALSERVLSVAMRNPITGLGPAAYRSYANTEPLLYGRAFWAAPLINSHNNYVDLFAHGGLLGLGLFLWFVAECILSGLRLRQRYRADFAGGYVASLLAAGSAALVIMLLADWILPFVYNIGFHGFQASVLVWLFLGGLITLEYAPEEAPP